MAVTLGIDLASQPKETAVCVIEWAAGRGKVRDIVHGPLTDNTLLGLMRDGATTKVGIDAPLGWPLAFIDAISTYRDRGEWLLMEPNEIRFRATDNVVAVATGQTPLSVAMSDLAWPAMRCARLLAHAEAELDRSGDGRVAEVYPAAALRRWGLIPAGSAAKDSAYKGDKPGRRDRRQQLLDELMARLDGVVEVPSAVAARCVDDDDELDAFVCALIARAVEVGCTDPVPRGMRWVALREGWIHLPTADSLPRLADG
jgi:hypothetical protein